MNYLCNESDRRMMIESFLKNNPVPIATGKILDIENDKPENYDVYEMPMYFFVHNWKNGRHFIEAQNQLINLNEKKELDPVKDNELIETMLYQSKVDRNDLTKENLEKFSQQEPIIATKSGIIIDGNRRFMLLKRIWREKKLSLKEQKLKVIILKKDFSNNELNSLETKIQFRKEEKVDYDPINKKIKIFNMYEELLRSKNLTNKIEKFKFNIKNEILKEISDNTGESQSEIKKYLQIISFVKWFLDYKNASSYLSLFLNKDEQLKNLFTSVKKLNESKEKFSEIKMWFDKDKDIENMFVDASMYQILHKVKAVGSFRDIMVSKNNWSVLRYKDLFEKWYKKTIEIVGNDIFKFDVENREKREKLEELNKNIIREIEDREREELKNLRAENNLKDSSEIINDMQIENAISFFHKRLEYFQSIQTLSDFNRKKLEEISKVINKILLRQEKN